MLWRCNLDMSENTDFKITATSRRSQWINNYCLKFQLPCCSRCFPWGKNLQVGAHRGLDKMSDILIKILLRHVSKDLIDDKATLVQVMVSCWAAPNSQATIHYLNQCFDGDQCQHMAPLGHNELPCGTPGPFFCLLLGVSLGCARPITGQVT